MAVREILQLGHPSLYEIATKVREPQSDKIASLITDLEDTLNSFQSTAGYGRGIAAPQIGVSQRVIFVRMRPDGFVGALINPRIIKQSEQMVQLWDCCFSFPHLMVCVSRAATITVEYIDVDGLQWTVDAEEGLSELLQHEIDHLNGILATDRAISDRAMMTRAAWLKAGSPI